jgi:enolase-phosphatase E1
VARTLFPFARAHAGPFLAAHVEDAGLAGDLSHLREENAADWVHGDDPPAWGGGSAVEVLAYVLWLMDRDRKSTGLKALQGRIWEDGYRSSALRGELYDDVPTALRRWRDEGRRVAIFSSGSILAQRLLFRHSTAGDLTPLLDAHFDTTTGPKREASSYQLIAGRLGVAPSAVLFVSDVTDELDAARAAGMETALAARDALPVQSSHRVVRSFDALP